MAILLIFLKCQQYLCVMGRAKRNQYRHCIISNLSRRPTPDNHNSFWLKFLRGNNTLKIYIRIIIFPLSYIGLLSKYKGAQCFFESVSTRFNRLHLCLRIMGSDTIIKWRNFGINLLFIFLKVRHGFSLALLDFGTKWSSIFKRFFLTEYQYINIPLHNLNLIE